MAGCPKISRTAGGGAGSSSTETAAAAAAYVLSWITDKNAFKQS